MTQSIINRNNSWSSKKLNEALIKRSVKVLFYDKYMLGEEFDYKDYFDVKMLLRLNCGCFDKFKEIIYKKINEL